MEKFRKDHNLEYKMACISSFSVLEKKVLDFTQDLVKLSFFIYYQANKITTNLLVFVYKFIIEKCDSFHS